MCNSCTSVLPNTEHVNNKNEIRQINREEGIKERSAGMEKSKEGTKEKKSRRPIIIPNQNIIIIYIIWYYFIRYGKSTMKFKWTSTIEK